MPFVTTEDEATGLVTITYSGELTGEQIARSVGTLARRPHRSDRLDVLWDMRSATSLSLIAPDVDAVARGLTALAERFPEGRGAYLANPDQPLFTAMIKVTLTKLPPGKRERRGFFDADEALAWLCAR